MSSFTPPASVIIDNNLLHRFQHAALEDDRHAFSISTIYLVRIELAISLTTGLTFPLSRPLAVSMEQYREMICIEIALLLLEKKIPAYAFEGLASFCKFCNFSSEIRYQDDTVKLLLRLGNSKRPPLWAYGNGTWGSGILLGNEKPDFQMLIDGQKGRGTLRPYLERYE